MKVVENSPQNCTIFKNFPGGHAPKPPSNGSQLCCLRRTCRFAACIPQISKKFQVGPPLRNPAYAPRQFSISVVTCLKFSSFMT